jgi:hypothetical protein
MKLWKTTLVYKYLGMQGSSLKRRIDPHINLQGRCNLHAGQVNSAQYKREACTHDKNSVVGMSMRTSQGSFQD